MIDWTQVAQIRTEVGPEDFDEVVDLFFEEVEEVTARLSASDAPAQLGEDLHFLKGSALNLGFSAFSTACNAGEALCTTGKTAQVDITAILSTYLDSKQAFLDGIPTAFSNDAQTSL